MDGTPSVLDAVSDRQSYGSVMVDHEPIFVAPTGPGALHVSREHCRTNRPLARITFNPSTWTVTGVAWKTGWGHLAPDWQDRVVEAAMQLVRARTKVCNG